MELLIVTGMSGAGKSVAAHALEDIGFYCVDNIPPSLIPPFADLCMRGQTAINRMAIVTDIRGGELLKDIIRILARLKEKGVAYKVLFLDAGDECLERRYKETRRRHPLCDLEHLSISDAVKREREFLLDVRKQADYIVNTSHLSVAQLKTRLANLFMGNASQAMNIQCISFGFKYGSVLDADLIFDVRCLPNPFYVDKLRALTGLDDDIRDYVMSSEQTKGYISRMLDFIDYVVPLYCNEGKSQLVIAIGCTGGKHRSVVLTELLYTHLCEKGYRTGVNHRDIRKN